MEPMELSWIRHCYELTQLTENYQLATKWVHGNEGKRKRKAERKTETEIFQLSKVDDHYHSVFFDMNYDQ